jgi:hypothetical protein
VQRNKNIGKLQAGYLFPEVKRLPALLAVPLLPLTSLSPLASRCRGEKDPPLQHTLS